MHLVSVAPIVRGNRIPELNYFSKHHVAVGSLITADVRNREVHAIVLSCEPVRDMKLAIRSADFALKKITPRASRPFLLPALVETLTRGARYYASSPGELLYHLIPQSVLAEIDHILPDDTHPTHGHDANTTRHEHLLFQAGRTERYDEYKNLVRSLFAKKRSLLILVPGRIDAERVAGALTKSAGPYLYVFHGGLTPKKMQLLAYSLLREPHPVAIVMTAGTLALPRSDIGTIVIERESGAGYKQPRRPFADLRTLATWYAEALGIPLSTADLPLSVAAMHRLEAGHAQPLRDIPTRVPKTVPAHLIDVREAKPLHPRSPFVVLGADLHRAIQETALHGGHTFLFAARRGIAPVTICQDCGTRVSCLACGAPVVLHRMGNDQVFVCHACGAMRSAHETCKQCTSWKLTPLGIGVQLVEREIEHLFPDTPRFVLTRDSVKTHRNVLATMREYMATPGAILIGTEMALPYMPLELDTVGVVSLDSMLSMPGWNMYERILTMLFSLREATRGALYVQTRKPEEELLKLALNGNLSTFYRTEFADRKQYGYPPYSTLVKISCEGRDDMVRATMRTLAERLAPYGFTMLPHVLTTPKATALMHGFLRLQPEDIADVQSEKPQSRSRRKPSPTDHSPAPIPTWPNDTLIDRIGDLMSLITIEVDPERIL